MGAFSAGVAPVAAYSIQQMLNNRNNGGQGQADNMAAAFPAGYNPGGGTAQLYGNDVTGLHQ